MRSINASDQIAGQPSEEPLVVAWRPGRNGIAAVPASRVDASGRLRIDLPPPLVLHGRVTVGGNSFSGRLGIVQVIAIHEGHGLVGGLCRQEVSADADGNFELAGLTPGTYQLQATLDNIWLSKSVRVMVDRRSSGVEADRIEYSRAGKAEQCLDYGQGGPRRAECGTDIGTSRRAVGIGALAACVVFRRSGIRSRPAVGSRQA